MLCRLAADTITADSANVDERSRFFGGVAQASMVGSLLGTFLGFGLLLSLTFDRAWSPLFFGYGAVSFGAALWSWRRLL